MRYVLSETTIHAPGMYHYRSATEQEAIQWLKDPWVSFIQDEETARKVQELGKRKAELSEKPLIMEPEDQALVVRKERSQKVQFTEGKKPFVIDRWEYGVLLREI
jgi:hypothetical protein